MLITEITHRHLCHISAAWLLARPDVQLSCWELKYARGIVDAIGVSIKDKKITIIEAKRTRPDLLSDLRSQKLLKYEKRSTHCYIAATAEALHLNKVSNQECLLDLETRGLPAHWGVALIDPLNRTVKCLRAGQRHKTVRETTIRNLVLQMGRAHQYRHMAQLGILL